MQPLLDQGEDNVSDIVDDIYGSNTNSNADHYHKSDESAGSLVSNNSPGFTHCGGRHLFKHSGSESFSNSPRFTHRGGPLNARKGMNVGVFFLGKKQNAEILTSCLNQRDTYAFGKNYIHASFLFLLQSKSNHLYR